MRELLRYLRRMVDAEISLEVNCTGFRAKLSATCASFTAPKITLHWTGPNGVGRSLCSELLAFTVTTYLISFWFLVMSESISSAPGWSILTCMLSGLLTNVRNLFSEHVNVTDWPSTISSTVAFISSRGFEPKTKTTPSVTTHNANATWRHYMTDILTQH